MPYVESPEIYTKEDIPHVGGKAAHLAELIKAGFPVPECFFITVEAYNKFLEANALRAPILDTIAKTDFSSPDSLAEASKKIRTMIEQAEMPAEIRDAIIRAYRKLAGAPDPALRIEFVRASQELPFVAVRSSAVLEDIEKTSSAGQQETYLNVRGDEALITSVKKVWASLFTPRAIYYRYRHNQPQDTAIGVIVQRMVNAEKAGVSFTVDPARPVEGKDEILTEAAFGVGEVVVQGLVDPDEYRVSKTTGDIIDKKIGKKTIQRVRDPVTGKTVEQPVPEALEQAQVLTDDEIRALSAYCKKIEDYYNGFPQDIEWCIEKGKIYIVQTRAVTALEKKEVAIPTPVGAPVLRGYGVSPGVATGPVKIIHEPAELGKIIKGDVLVTAMTAPDFVPAMEKSAAIVTDLGGSTSHAAIVSRELGIPCIVGTKTATKILRDGQVIMVDAVHGLVYPAEALPGIPPAVVPPVLPPAPPAPPEIRPAIPVTATEIKVNIAFPETAQKIAPKADGVGLLRLEHMLTKAGLHPVEYIRERKQPELIKIIADGVGLVAKAFAGKPVWVRSLDARTDEFRRMKGGEREPTEPNPMLGWHGIRRSLDEPEILRCEFKALKQLHAEGLTNIAVMIPFTIDVSELRKAKAIAKEVGYTGKFGVMVETPAACLTIEDFCREGIDFISFGTNDLTQTVLGVDRNNERLIKLFDEMHPAMLFLYKHVIDICKKYGVKTSICGEAPSNRYEIVEHLIKLGIDSLSVNIDAVDRARAWAAHIERKILLEKLK